MASMQRGGFLSNFEEFLKLFSFIRLVENFCDLQGISSIHSVSSYILCCASFLVEGKSSTSKDVQKTQQRTFEAYHKFMLQPCSN